jgi:hypothetical protein
VESFHVSFQECPVCTCLDPLERPKSLLHYDASPIPLGYAFLYLPVLQPSGRLEKQRFTNFDLAFTNMLSSLFTKVFADEEPADDKEAAKAEEATQAKTEETPAEAVEEEAEEPEDVSCHRQATPKNC